MPETDFDIGDWSSIATPLEDIRAVRRQSASRTGEYERPALIVSRNTALVSTGVYTIRGGGRKHKHRFGKQRLAALERAGNEVVSRLFGYPTSILNP